MAKQSKSLFAQIRDEEAAQQVATTFWTSAAFRWALVAVSIVAMTFTFPRTGLDTQSGGFDRMLLGTTWTQEDVVADYTFPVSKDAEVLRAQQDSARTAAPIVVAELAGPTQPISTRLASATANLSEPARRWVRTHWQELSDLFVARPIVDLAVDSLVLPVLTLRASDGTEQFLDAADVTDTARIRSALARLVVSAPLTVREEVVQALRPLIDPALGVDPQATRASREAAAASVPVTAEIVRAGDVIVVNGQRLDEATLRRLAGYRNAQYLRSEAPFNFYMLLGSLGHALLIAAFVVLYLLILRPSSFERPGQLGSLLALPVLTGLLGWISLRLEPGQVASWLVSVRGEKAGRESFEVRMKAGDGKFNPVSMEPTTVR